MSHFAKIDKDNIVQGVHVVDNENLLNEQGVEEESIGVAFLDKVHGAGHTWVQTSYNHNFRKQYAGKGFTYDKTNDVFIQPQLFPSWSLDSSFDWQPPTSMPADASGGGDGKHYFWNEDTQAWDEME